jgi:hypothetical protein
MIAPSDPPRARTTGQEPVGFSAQAIAGRHQRVTSLGRAPGQAHPLTAATLAPVGLRLRPQRLPAAQYEAMLDLAATVDPAAVEGTPWPEPTVAQIESIAPVAEPDTPEERVAQVVVGAAPYEASASADEPGDNSTPNAGAC